MRRLYVVGDLSNGDFAKFSDVKEAVEFYYESIRDLTLENIQSIGEDGCPWKDEEDCKRAAEALFYVKEVTLDEDGEVNNVSFDFIY